MTDRAGSANNREFRGRVKTRPGESKTYRVEVKTARAVRTSPRARVQPAASRRLMRWRCRGTMSSPRRSTSDSSSSTRSPSRRRPRTSKKFDSTSTARSIRASRWPAQAAWASANDLNGVRWRLLHQPLGRAHVEAVDAGGDHFARGGVQVDRCAHRQDHDEGSDPAQRVGVDSQPGSVATGGGASMAATPGGLRCRPAPARRAVHWRCASPAPARRRPTRTGAAARRPPAGITLPASSIRLRRL